MIWYSQPFVANKNIGSYYNDFMELIGENDWACFTDGDTLHLDSHYGIYIQEYTEHFLDVGLWTCMTNRVITKYQLLKGYIDEDHNILSHRKLAKKNFEENRLVMEYLDDPNTPFSGCMILISKKAWREAGGFSEGGLGVDNEIYYAMLKTSFSVGLMKGYYLYHFYRGDKDYKNTDHFTSL